MISSESGKKRCTKDKNGVTDNRKKTKNLSKINISGGKQYKNLERNFELQEKEKFPQSLLII